MLSAWLRTHDLASMIREEARGLYPPAADRAAWTALSPEHRQEIRSLEEAYRALPYPLRPASGFLAFAREGIRQADEQPYFTRRRKLCTAVLACCADPGREILDVVDGLWLICEESSWVISAHNVNPIPGAPTAQEYPLPDVRRPYVDLFSAQTGMILALTGHLLGDALDRVTPLLRERVRLEIRRRILDPFRATDDFWWMGVRRKDLNNWTPWILSNILVCAALDPMDARELAALIGRACGMLDRYLDTLPADGGCDEGAGYWNMAGGALLDCLCLLEKLTGGRMTFWQEEKLRHILRFPLAEELGNGWFVNFADCDARPFLSGERIETAGERIGDAELRALGRRMRGTLADQLNDVPHLTRVLDLLFHPASEEAPETPGRAEKDVYLPDLQLRVLGRGGFLLACRGGHNGENHNHNDVGSFLLMLDGQPAVVDAGNAVYTAATFSDARYTLWHIRSAYHSVPLVDGLEQLPGAEHRAEDVEATPDGLRLRMESAYGAEAGLLVLRRSFALSEDGLRLTDEIRLREARPVTWVFLLREEPHLEGGRILAGRLCLEAPPSLSFRREEIPITDPRMARNWPGSLWRVCLTGEAAGHHLVHFLFRRN